MMLRPEVEKSSDPYVIFPSAYAYMALGKSDAVPNGVQRLLNVGCQPYLVQWLLIEHAGRCQEFVRQAEFFRMAFDREKGNRDWIFHALLRSLDQSFVDMDPLRRVLPVDEGRGAVFDLLRWMIGQGNGEERVAQLEFLAESNPRFAPVHIQLAAVYFNNGQGGKSLSILDHVANLDALDAGAISRMLSLIMMMHLNIDDAEHKLLKLMEIVPNTVRQKGIVASYLLIFYWISNKMESAFNLIKENLQFTVIDECENDKSARIFFNYILNLCVYRQKNKDIYHGNGCVLNVIGESHSLSPHMTSFHVGDILYSARANFVIGCKMFHLSNDGWNIYKEAVVSHLSKVAPGSGLMFTVGEIDCRPDEGIWPARLKSIKSIKEIVESTIDGYLNFLNDAIKGLELSKVIIQGIPAPGYELSDKIDAAEVRDFLMMVNYVNSYLKNSSLKRGWFFLDVYSATVDENFSGNFSWHLDKWHLKPDFYQFSNKWLIGG